MNKVQAQQLVTLFQATKLELESKGLSDKQVFGVLFNKEYATKSGIIFTLNISSSFSFLSSIGVSINGIK